MGDTVIRVENISKEYRLGKIGTGTLGHDLNRWWHTVRGKEDPYLKIGEVNDRTKKGYSEYVWALQDVSFDVKQGEVLGIIGRNGAGKSTLLKILSRTTLPTQGQIKIKGRVASLLEVGTGFHPELTGRENIFLNGAILGMTKAEIKSKFDEIVDFSGVERYIDTPVKRYSSGMYVRLAFAVAAFLEPEILIVDEVLAVGDAEFQKKCLGRMRDISINDGRTVLFVSHNMPSINNLCSKAILLERGGIEAFGLTESVVHKYLSNNHFGNSVALLEIQDIYRIYDLSRRIEYKQLEFIGGEAGNIFSTQEVIKLRIRLKGNYDCINFRIAFSIKSNDESVVGTYFSPSNLSIGNGEEKDYYVIMNNHQLAKGIYYLDLSVGLGEFTTGITEFDNISKTLSFEILYTDKEKVKMYSLWMPYMGKICFQDFEVVENL